MITLTVLLTILLAAGLAAALRQGLRNDGYGHRPPPRSHYDELDPRLDMRWLSRR